MAGDRSRLFWRLSVLCGAGVIAFAVWFGGVIPTRTCSGPLPAGVSALLTFQLSRTTTDIEHVFGAAGDPCRVQMVAAMDRANMVDLLGFIATYSAFLACFFLASWRAGAGAAAHLGLAAVVAALTFDVVETATQLHITGDLPGSPAALTWLAIGSTGKYLALAMVCACAGAAMITRGPVVGRIAGAVCIAGALMVIIGLAGAPARAALSAGNALAWLIILLYAATASVQPAA